MILKFTLDLGEKDNVYGEILHNYLLNIYISSPIVKKLKPNLLPVQIPKPITNQYFLYEKNFNKSQHLFLLIFIGSLHILIFHLMIKRINLRKLQQGLQKKFLNSRQNLSADLVPLRVKFTNILHHNSCLIRYLPQSFQYLQFTPQFNVLQ